jgi:lipoyl(octanoyl) transferase
VDNDMAPFEWAVACGLPGVRMTSMKELGSAESVACFRKRMGHAFARELGRRQRLVTPGRLESREPAWTSA